MTESLFLIDTEKGGGGGGEGDARDSCCDKRVHSCKLLKPCDWYETPKVVVCASPFNIGFHVCESDTVYNRPQACLWILIKLSTVELRARRNYSTIGIG